MIQFLMSVSDPFLCIFEFFENIILKDPYMWCLRLHLRMMMLYVNLSPYYGGNCCCLVIFKEDSVDIVVLNKKIHSPHWNSGGSVPCKIVFDPSYPNIHPVSFPRKEWKQ